MSPDSMATAMSIDQTEAPTSCLCPQAPQLEVNFVSVKDPAESLTASARRQEIFFDWVSLLVAEQDVHYVLDERFDSFLDQDHREFKGKMLHLLQDLSGTCRSTPVYHKLEGFLRRHLGYDSLTFWQAASLESGKARIHSPSPTKDVPMKLENSNPGHVFCINGSVCDLSCDAFLCPVAIGRKSDGLSGTIFAQWRRQLIDSYPELLDYLVSRDGSKKGFKPNKTFRLKRYEDCPNIATLAGWPWRQFETHHSLAFLNSLEVESAAFNIFEQNTPDLPKRER
jgi:hypothetical protein